MLCFKLNQLGLELRASESLSGGSIRAIGMYCAPERQQAVPQRRRGEPERSGLLSS